MARLTISISDEAKAKVENYSKTYEISESAVIRMALAKFFEPGKPVEIQLTAEDARFLKVFNRLVAEGKVSI